MTKGHKTRNSGLTADRNFLILHTSVLRNEASHPVSIARSPRPRHCRPDSCSDGQVSTFKRTSRPALALETVSIVAPRTVAPLTDRRGRETRSEFPSPFISMGLISVIDVQ